MEAKVMGTPQTIYKVPICPRENLLRRTGVIDAAAAPASFNGRSGCMFSHLRLIGVVAVKVVVSTASFVVVLLFFFIYKELGTFIFYFGLYRSKILSPPYCPPLGSGGG